MTQTQRILLALGIAGITILCLCPPHQWVRTTYLVETEGAAPKTELTTENAGHHWIWGPPEGSTAEGKRGGYINHVSNWRMVDWSRLGIYVGVIAALTLFAAFVVFRKKSERWGSHTNTKAG